MKMPLAASFSSNILTRADAAITFVSKDRTFDALLSASLLLAVCRLSRRLTALVLRTWGAPQSDLGWGRPARGRASPHLARVGRALEDDGVHVGPRAQLALPVPGG